VGKYTDDDITIIEKAEVGRLQLEDAIRMFLAESYFSAVTLAGAADGFFCGLIESAGVPTPAERTRSEIENLRAKGIPLLGTISRKEAFKTWNVARNALKHHSTEKDGEYLETYPIDEAYEWIERAKQSGQLLSIEARNYVEFEARVIPWFFL
jgi:hypothetical protein